MEPRVLTYDDTGEGEMPGRIQPSDMVRCKACQAQTSEFDRVDVVVFRSCRNPGSGPKGSRTVSGPVVCRQWTLALPFH